MTNSVRISAALLAGVMVCYVDGRLSASDEVSRAALIGAPTKITIQPEAVSLVGPRAAQQLVVTAHDANGNVRDVTQFCEWLADPLIRITPGGYVTPSQNGSGKLAVKLGMLSADIAVQVQQVDASSPVSFRREVMSVFNTNGCNAGSCHGIPSGRGGFKLSLWGFDPDADFLSLTKEEQGRRTNRLNPAASLILAKAQNLIPHQGGRRFAPDSMSAKLLTEWIAAGTPADPAGSPGLSSISVLPGSRALPAPARFQQLAVMATFDDGSVRDVTRLTVFTSSEPGIATVTPEGLVEFRRGGEVAVLCRYLDQVQSVRLMYLDVSPGFQWPNPPETNYVDQHVFAKLKRLGIAPSELCSDEEFIRRVSLDVTGTLPTPSDVRAFLASTDADKRSRLIESLLARDDYVDFWTMKWGDVLRIKKTLIQPKGVESYHGWLRRMVATNAGFDEVAEELITSQGHSYKSGPVNYFCVVREPKNAGELIQHDLTESTASLFLGIRLQCAKCHNHPFERWTQDDYHGLAAFFTQVKQTRHGNPPGVGNPEHRPISINFDAAAPEMLQPRTNKNIAPKFLGGDRPTFEIGEDRRPALAEWLTQPGNPFFAKSVVNRVWYHLLGRGIVDPVDDFRESNPSANDELLSALADDFVAHNFDVKHVIRTVANSRTYQLGSQPNEFNADDEKYFSRAIVKTLPAEVLMDAICAVTGVPEAYTNQPAGRRAIQLPDNDVIHQPSRYLGYDRHPFMKTFGQPARELACECARETEFSLAQALELMNGPTVAAKLSAAENQLSRLISQQMSDEQILEDLYLAALCRKPSDATAQAFLTYVKQAPNRRLAWEDVVWTILRSREFTSRH